MTDTYQARSHGDVATAEVALAQYVMFPDGRTFWTEDPAAALQFASEWERHISVLDLHHFKQQGLKPAVGYMRMLRSAYDKLRENQCVLP